MGPRCSVAQQTSASKCEEPQIGDCRVSQARLRQRMVTSYQLTGRIAQGDNLVRVLRAI